MSADTFAPVTANDFLEALGSLPARALRSRRKWLKLHLESDAMATTASVLADAADYRDWRGINSSYGRLAKQIRLILERSKQPSEADELFLLCEFVQRGSLTNQDCLLVMRPEFAQALQRSGLLGD